MPKNLSNIVVFSSDENFPADIDLDGNDTNRYVSPTQIYKNRDKYPELVTLINSFFSELIGKIKNNDYDGALKMLQVCFGERDYFGLGMKKDCDSHGNGSGKLLCKNVLKGLIKSKAVETGVISDIKDFEFLINYIGKDRISDMVLGICLDEFNKYTNTFCKKHLLQKSPRTYLSDGYTMNDDTYKIACEHYLDTNGNDFMFVPNDITVSKDTGYRKYVSNFQTYMSKTLIYFVQYLA